MNKLEPPCIRADWITLTIEIAPKRYKILQILFGKKDGSLYVNFPYFRYREGLVSLVTIPANISNPVDAEMNPGGKVTSHLVKYSHHPSGKAHFSQDGKVRSIVGKNAVPLTNATDHIFTIKIQGLHAFEEIVPEKEARKQNLKRKTLNFRLHGINPEAIKIVGRWYSKEEVQKRGFIQNSSPIFLGITPDKEKSFGVLLANPYLIQGDEYYLMLNLSPISKMSVWREEALTFLGGFDSHELIEDISKETSFLAFTYPILNIKELAAELGSIDFAIR